MTAAVPSRIRFTIFKTFGSRLSKQYTLADDGSVETDSGTQFAQGSYRVVDFDASDAVGALVEIGQEMDGLSTSEAIGLGVPLDGTTMGRITTKNRHAEGGTDAIPRTLDYFGWNDGPGLLLLDGDDIDGLQEILCELYSPFAEVAVLSRPSASASVVDPRTGKPLKTGEHVYVIVDDPTRSKDCLDAFMRLAWCCGDGKSAGRLKLSKSGQALIRGPVDASVGSPERLSYEGAAVLGNGLTALPRIARVTGGKALLCAADLLAYVDRVAPADQFDARVNAAKDHPDFCARRTEVQAAYRCEHITKAVARGVSRESAAELYDRTIAAGTCAIGLKTFVPLTSDHTLYWPDGKSFTVGDIQKDPTAFHGRECCDPVEGTSYQSRNCAIIYTNGPRIEIYSRAHGDAFAYVAPLEDMSVLFAELLAQVVEARGASGEADETPVSSGTDSTTAATAAEAWDPWGETLAPRLDHSLLPAVVREAAETSARVSGADKDAFAIGYLVGLAACADTRVRITPKQHARDWSVPLVLWVLLIAPPASMKSEVIKAARAMPASLDGQERERHRGEIAAAKISVGLGFAKMNRAEAKQARDEAVQKVAPPRQRVCGDVTIEKLADILGANPGGCSIVREELSGWLGGLGRYTANGTDAADRAFYCAMRDGSPHDRQRVSSPSVHIAHCAGSFLGAVQPDRLLEMKLPTADGLLQRFMPLIMREARSYEDSENSDDAKALLRPIRDRLAALAPVIQRDPFGQEVAVPYKLTPEGAELYKKFADDMRLAGRALEPSREFGECLNKMGPMWLSLALLFHLIEAETNGTIPERVPIGIARRADAIMRDFFIPHAEHFYDLLDGGGSAHRLRSIATAILRCPRDEIVLRDVVHRCRAMRGKDREEQIRLMQRFETFGWLTRVDRYGPAHPRWKRTPGLGTRFEEELKREEAARAAVTAAIKVGAAKI
jgi:hypothetical protein